MNKKGISDIVTTVLIILLVVAAVAIIWGFVSGPLNRGGQALEKATECLQLSVIPVSCKSGLAATNVTYRWQSGEGLVGVRVVFEKADGTTEVNSTGGVPLSVGASKTATLSGTGISSVMVQGVIRDSTGNNVPCSTYSQKISCEAA